METTNGKKLTPVVLPRNADFIKIREWFKDTIGLEYMDWTPVNLIGDRLYLFSKKSDAILFKLIFG